MTLSFPYVVYGYVYDSNSDIIPSVTVTATGDSPTTDISDSDGKYIINLMDYASSGGNVTMTCDYLGEKISSTFKVVQLNCPLNHSAVEFPEATVLTTHIFFIVILVTFILVAFTKSA